jgi:hypothetical protein
MSAPCDGGYGTAPIVLCPGVEKNSGFYRSFFREVESFKKALNAQENIEYCLDVLFHQYHFPADLCPLGLQNIKI